MISRTIQKINSQGLNHYQETKRKFKQAVQSILKEHNSYEIDEAALPAYAHKNPLIDFIFWQRVKTAYDYAAKIGAKKILDFGCGTGLLSYALATHDRNILAVDIQFNPLKLIKQKIDFPNNIHFVEANLLQYDVAEKNFDLIVALDVLEHIKNLDEYILEFKKLLKPGGVILISGPTENFLYKIGRKLAGEKFTGDYHVSNIHRIKQQFSKQMKTKTIKRLIWPVTLFEIFVAFND